jgi:hypothetical protein
MNSRELVRVLGLKVGPNQRRAFAYLERLGQVFCVHFGTDNAIEKAREHWRERQRAYREKRRLARRG